MSFETDLEKFETLMEGINSPSKSSQKSIMESIAVSNIKEKLFEGENNKKKDFQKKISNKIKQNKSIYDAKAKIKNLYEAMLKEFQYVTDSSAKQTFFESCKLVESSLNELASQSDNDISKELDIYKKYYETGAITPEDKQYLENKKSYKDTETPDTLEPDFDVKKNSMNLGTNPNV